MSFKEMEFLFNNSSQESDKSVLQTKGSASSNSTLFFDGDILSDKYVIIGVILFFVLLFLVAVLLQVCKSYRGGCCQEHEKSELYANLTNSEDDEDDTLYDIEYNHVNHLYTDCRLCVDEAEVNTSSERVDIVKDEYDFEYDCSSLSNSVVGLEQSISNSEEHVMTRSLSLIVSSKIASVFGRRSSKDT